MKKQIKNVLKYQYLLGKVSTFDLKIKECTSEAYQYLLGKVSTHNRGDFIWLSGYQYLLGKVSTKKKKTT